MEDVRALRERSGLTQLEMALALGVNPRTYQRWEKGRGLRPIREIYLERMRALAEEAERKAGA